MCVLSGQIAAAVKRGRGLECSICGMSGATRGCSVGRCEYKAHVTCAGWHPSSSSSSSTSESKCPVHGGHTFQSPRLAAAAAAAAAVGSPARGSGKASSSKAAASPGGEEAKGGTPGGGEEKLKKEQHGGGVVVGKPPEYKYRPPKRSGTRKVGSVSLLDQSVSLPWMDV